MTDEEGNLEQKTGEFPSRLGAYCLECGTAARFYLIGIQKNSEKDSALYICATCRHTLDYDSLTGEERK